MSKERSSVMKCQRERSRWRICMNTSWRTKIIAGFMVILLTLVLTSSSATVLRWQRHHNSAPVLTPRHRYTVLINTWKRNDLLKKSVAHYASCHGTSAVRVVWSEQEPPSESLRSKLLDSVGRRRRGGAARVELRIDMNDEDDLNNRFKPLEGLSTTAVLSIDDDVLVPCSTLELAFTVWLSAQDTMVGFVPRMHWTGSKSEMYTYGGWWSIWWTGSYSMVLTKAAFLHHKYFEYYTYEMPAEIREFVKNQRNCEDIAMSFLVANVTRAPPIWVKGNIYEIGSTGISSLKGHNYQRTLCLNYLTTLYGHMPLVSTNVKAVDAQMEWFW